MNDAHVSWRAPMTCVILFIVASTLPAAAQPRDLAHVDLAVSQQQAFLDQLKSSVEQLKKDNDALQQKLNDIDRKTAPPEAWRALGFVGLIFVIAWAGVAVFRELTRRKELEAETQQKTSAAVDRQALLIEAAAEARIKALAALMHEVKGSSGLWELLKGTLR